MMGKDPYRLIGGLLVAGPADYFHEGGLFAVHEYAHAVYLGA